MAAIIEFPTFDAPESHEFTELTRALDMWCKRQPRTPHEILSFSDGFRAWQCEDDGGEDEAVTEWMVVNFGRKAPPEKWLIAFIEGYEENEEHYPD